MALERERRSGQPGRALHVHVAHDAADHVRLRHAHGRARCCSSASRCSAISTRRDTAPSTCGSRRATVSECRSRSSTVAGLFRRDGSAPLLQYGYGAYGISSDPHFSSSVLSLLDRGFVYAIAQVRGGQERGRRWYDAGRLLAEAHTFEDFIDVTTIPRRRPATRTRRESSRAAAVPAVCWSPPWRTWHRSSTAASSRTCRSSTSSPRCSMRAFRSPRTSTTSGATRTSASSTTTCFRTRRTTTSRPRPTRRCSSRPGSGTARCSISSPRSGWRSFGG